VLGNPNGKLQRHAASVSGLMRQRDDETGNGVLDKHGLAPIDLMVSIVLRP